MLTTTNSTARTLAYLLRSHGVQHVVVSPGSRNAPLLIAIASCPEIQTTVVIDERSAAFMALGISDTTQQPTALICTSGTALLNYAPAIAEAYYRKTPLIVISADRPTEWIDQDDSQTLHQYEALANFVKQSYDIPAHNSESNVWYANRIINDAIITATTGRKAPVHINIRISEPLGHMAEHPGEKIRKINIFEPTPTIDPQAINRLSMDIVAPAKVMVIAGFHHPDKMLNMALNKLASQSNIIVLTETISNLHGNNFVDCIDTTLAAMSQDDKNELRPDIVITLGGALVSRHIKQYLRSHQPQRHWHVGLSNTTIDCFKSLTERIDIEPEVFFTALSDNLATNSDNLSSDYSSRWIRFREKGTSILQSHCDKAQWSDLKAFATLLPMIPHNWNVQYSNGTPIRYSQLFGDKRFHRCSCNRGVSGIDGSTSTAIGASLAYSETTLLISGDMSASYDIGALTNHSVTHLFKIIVICNGGGEIFRFIESTRNLDILDKYFCVAPHLPLEDIANGHGYAYFEANNENELRDVFPTFRDENQRPAILAIKTPSEISANTLYEFFNNHTS